MTANNFASALGPSPDLAAALARRERLFTKLNSQPFFSVGRDELVRETWSETAVIAGHLAHDQAVADTEAAIPRATTTKLAEWENFFLAIARTAQTAAEPQVLPDTLRRYGLLPTFCADVTALHRHAQHLTFCLDRADTDQARHIMHDLVATCTFGPGTRAERD